MASHSSVLASRIPEMGEPGGLPSYGVAESRTRLKWLSSSSHVRKVLPQTLVRGCCFCLVTQSCPVLCDPMNCSTPGFPVPHYLLEFAQANIPTESMMPSNHFILCHNLPLLPSIFPSIRVFSNEWALHSRWSKYWSFSFRISLSNEYSGLISFRIDWFDLLAVQRTLLQHHSLKASILWCSAFFMVQLSHPYMTAGKTIALTIRTFVSRG